MQNEPESKLTPLTVVEVNEALTPRPEPTFSARLKRAGLPDHRVRRGWRLRKHVQKWLSKQKAENEI